MTKPMRTKLASFDIIHSNFSLKCALFFFNKFSLTDYKINFKSTIDSIYDLIDTEQKTFILGVLPKEIKESEWKKTMTLGMGVIGDKKIFKKEVVSTSDSKYKDFDISTAIQTYDILGKHLSEFPRSDDEMIPEIFTVIFSYFKRNKGHMNTEGLFRLAGSKERLKEIEAEIYEGNYFYIGRGNEQ